MEGTSCKNCQVFQESEKTFGYGWCYVIGHYVAPTDNTGICKPIIEKLKINELVSIRVESLLLVK